MAYIFLAAVGGFGALLCFSLVIFTLSRRQLRSPSYASFISLCTNGILFGSLYLMPRYGTDFSRDTPVICHMLPRLGQALLLNVGLHVSVMTIERYFAIVYPFKYQRFITRGTVMVIILFLWFLVIGLQAIVSGLEFIQINQTVANKCAYSRGFENTSNLINAGFSVALSCLTLIILIYVYTLVLIIIRRHQDKIRRQLTLSNPDKIAVKTRKKAVLQTGLLFGVYLVFFLPFLFVTAFLPRLPFSKPLYYFYINVLRNMAFIFPFIQPLLYLKFTANINRELKSILGNLSVHKSAASNPNIAILTFEKSIGMQI
ncbi:Trace amine-associated receptor 2 [Trichoplax sp. H2]|nr:Trace amine-associated receptor 2 [Trichoplax sp. H2]|eukprot:RDD37449.1 Trace amine-associated receptor 2 [Trichoplax sp. H2]